MSEKSLKNKTLKGLGWSSLDNVAQHLVSFFVGIVLARLLTPADYGLLGVVGIFTSICQALIAGGFASALIRKKDATEDDYNTVFFVNLGMSLLLYLIIFSCSPWIAHFFKRQELVALTRVISINMVLGAFGLVQRTRLTKQIDFKTQTKITFIASVLSGLVGITMALLRFGVWALVAQSITNLLLRTILLCIFNRWFPKLQFSKSSFSELFGFGWKIMVSGILDTFWKDLYQVIVAKFYSPATLGQYSRAKHFSSLFSSNLTNIIQRVTYPVLSDIQNDRKQLIAAYRKIIKLTMFLTFPCMFFLGAIAEPIIICLIGEKWSEATIYLPWICFISSTYPLHSINLNMLQLQGRSDIFLILEIIKKVVALGPLFIGAFVGILPMLYVSVITNIISYFLNSFYTGKSLGYSSWMQLKDISCSFFIAFASAALVYCFKFLNISYWFVLPIQGVVFLILFLAFCIIVKSEEFYEIKSIVLSKIKK